MKVVRIVNPVSVPALLNAPPGVVIVLPLSLPDQFIDQVFYSRAHKQGPPPIAFEVVSSECVKLIGLSPNQLSKHACQAAIGGGTIYTQDVDAESRIREVVPRAVDVLSSTEIETDILSDEDLEASGFHFGRLLTEDIKPEPEAPGEPNDASEAIIAAENSDSASPAGDVADPPLPPADPSEPGDADAPVDVRSQPAGTPPDGETATE